MTAISEESPLPRFRDPVEYISRWGCNVDRRRDSWAQFLVENKERIKDMIRARMSHDRHRAHDTSDTFGSVLFAIDRQATRQDWRPRSVDEIWKRLPEIIDGIVERERLLDLRTLTTESDPQFARELESILESGEEVSAEVDRRLRRIKSPTTRQILIMRLEGASRVMIAQAFGMTEEAVKKQLHRAYAEIRTVTP